jgi:transposase
MRFVPVKSAGRLAALLDHKARDFLVRQRSQTINAIRAHLSQFGIVVAKGIHNVSRLIEAASNVPEAAYPALELLAGQLRDLEERIEAASARIAATQRDDPLARRLATIPGLGPIASSRASRRDAGRGGLPVRGTMPPGSGSRRVRTRRAARSGWAGYRRRGTDTCGGCSTLARRAGGTPPA